METVLGIGGVFFRARDPDALHEWYRANLGVPAVVFTAESGDVMVSSTFAADTAYFGRRDQQSMLNYRVRDLDAILAQLRAAGPRWTKTSMSPSTAASGGRPTRRGTASSSGSRPRALIRLLGVSAFPKTRLRRLRRTDRLRGLVRETRLDLDDFVMPLFVGPESLTNPELPAMGRFSVDDVLSEADVLAGLGVRAALLFGIPEEKDEEASGAYDDDGIIQAALRALRGRHPELLLLTDVCLCEYTSHGHCGVIRDGEVANDESLDLIARTAVSHAEAGADAVCPSDMMDGRVGAVREALDDAGFEQIPIVSYAAKYASAFYGPFREAAESAPAFGDRRGYQMDAANVREAARELSLDVAEGADALIVKPALPYLDVIRAARERFDLPIAAYNVSGEYAMVKATAGRGWMEERAAALESLTAIKRAGADFVVSYWTKELAGWL